VEVEGYELKGAEGRGRDLGIRGECGNLCSKVERMYHGSLRQNSCAAS